MGIDKLTFYYPLPRFGQKFSAQIPDFRENFSNLASLIRAAQVDVSPTTGEHDLARWMVGELDFRNRYGMYYDKAADQLTIQYNSGTEAVPIWNDALIIRDSDNRVIAAGAGGFQSLQGFYTPHLPALRIRETEAGGYNQLHATLFVDSDFFYVEGKSGQTGGALLSFKGLTDVNVGQVNTGSSLGGDADIFVQKVGVDLQFRGATGGDGITLTERNDDILFALDKTAIITAQAFYTLSGGDVTAGGGVTDHGALTGLTDDDHTQYSLADGTRSFTGRVTITAGGMSVAGPADYTGPVSGESFYAKGVITASGGSLAEPSVEVGEKGTGIYLNSPSVMDVAIQGGFTAARFTGFGVRVPDGNAASPSHSFINDTDSGLFSTNSNTEVGLSVGGSERVRFGAGGRVGIGTTTPQATLHVQGDALFENGKVVAAGFYTPDGGDVTGGGGGVTDHGALTGLSDDDHPQYSLVDGTRAFTGKVTISSGGASITGDVSASGKVTGDGFYVPGVGEVGPLTVEEADGAPSVVGVSKIIVSNGTLTNNGDGSVNITTGGAAGGSITRATGTFTSAVEINLTHGFSDNNMTWAIYDDNNEAIIPTKVVAGDTTLDFYLAQATTGRVVAIGAA